MRYLAKKVDEAVSSDKPNGVDETAMNFLLGARWEDWDHKAVHIIKMIDWLNTELPGARALYDSLSEFAHPNWSGTAMSFSKADRPTLITYFGNYPRGPESIASQCVAALGLSLSLIEHYYERFSELFSSFSEFCKSHFESRKQA
jgi:hypothetical protein